MGAQEPEGAFSRAGLSAVVRPTPRLSTLAVNGHLKLRTVEVENGLGNHGEPAEEEVIVVEEPEESKEEGPRVMRAPRVPTPREVEAHEATHIPHEE